MSVSMDELADLYRRYGLVLERRCARILGSGPDGRDAAHEAFARAAAKLSSFRAEGERLAWLYRISTNVCLNVLRERRRRNPDWERGVADAADASRSDGGLSAAERAAALRLLELAADDLTRALVLHVYIDEMSQGEAAELMGISRATVNARLARFRERAREQLGQKGAA